MIKKQLICVLAIFVWAVSSVAGQSSYFRNWPAGSEPDVVGKRLAENWLKRDFEFQSGKRQFVIYPEICTWYGSLTIAAETKDVALRDKLIQKFDRFTTADGQKNISPAAHVDYRVFGVVPLEIFLQNRDQKYRTQGQSFADLQWGKTTDDGITAEARYWIDDMYMITAVQVQAFRATGDKKYLERAAKTMAAYLDKLQQPNGLFFHAPDAQFYWGRGNGWQAAGMTELLRVLPRKHPLRARIMRGYTTMMESLLQYQAEDGLWRQLVDKPESWVETSGTGMFAFALITGVKQGWLPAKKFGPAARKSWLGLVAKIDANADVTEVCEGTNKGFTIPYYLDRKRRVGDLHGQAAATWAATALLRKK